MKTKNLLLLSLLLIATGLFAQTPIIAPTTDILATLYSVFGSWLMDHKWFSVVITVAVILEQIIPLIKWIPGNSILAGIWGFVKQLVAFIANKKA